MVVVELPVVVVVGRAVVVVVGRVVVVFGVVVVVVVVSVQVVGGAVVLVVDVVDVVDGQSGGLGSWSQGPPPPGSICVIVMVMVCAGASPAATRPNETIVITRTANARRTKSLPRGLGVQLRSSHDIVPEQRSTGHDNPVVHGRAAHPSRQMAVPR